MEDEDVDEDEVSHTQYSYTGTTEEDEDEVSHTHYSIGHLYTRTRVDNRHHKICPVPGCMSKPSKSYAVSDRNIDL